MQMMLFEITQTSWSLCVCYLEVVYLSLILSLYFSLSLVMVIVNNQSQLLLRTNLLHKHATV